jgi:DNA-binding NarL/FixJ family response regulator
MITVVIVDDQILFAESLKNILEMRTRDLKVIGVVYDGDQAVKTVDARQPDVVLMDVRMPGQDGVQAARIILERHPQVKIVMLTTFDDDTYVHEALRYGAVGYLLKTTRPAELIAAIRAIKQGTVQISQEIAMKLVREVTQQTPRADSPIQAAQSAEMLKSLSHRERELVKCLLGGLSNKQIAERLFIAEQTVKNHLSIIYSKLGVRNRSQAMVKLAQANPYLTSY